ncbi:ribosomal protein L7/L12 [Runella limosa]|uniref:ribosomal protein L7/L12 n=1 Tax=Runella limosa TaxID=370978 RepID=UPI00041DD547|nr:ribosomal protein L7/L12 [Runella limosa]
MKSILFLAMLSLSTMLIAKPLAEVVDEKEGYFTVVLLQPKNQKTVAHVTKVVATILGVSQKEAKAIVASAPVVLSKNPTKEEAATIKSALEAAGAEVEVK